jgi:hypothetical protein
MLEEALKRFPPSERQAWVREVKRLTYIILTYASIVKKRQLNRETGKYEFVSDVLLLCQQAKCNDPILISREPHRAFSPSPDTLDRWHRNYQRSGPTVFLRNPSKISSDKTDRRYAIISVEAIDYINRNWRQYCFASSENGHKSSWHGQ